MYLPLMNGQTALYQVVVRLNPTMKGDQPQQIGVNRLKMLNEILAGISEKMDCVHSSKLLDVTVFLLKSRYRPNFITETLDGNTSAVKTTFLQAGETVFVTELVKQGMSRSIGLSNSETWLQRNSS